MIADTLTFSVRRVDFALEGSSSAEKYHLFYERTCWLATDGGLGLKLHKRFPGNGSVILDLGPTREEIDLHMQLHSDLGTVI